MTIAEVQKEYPYVQWLDYINALLPAELKINEKEVIIISVPSFFKDLEGLLANTSKRWEGVKLFLVLLNPIS